jgi:hypothetical protein
MGVRGRTDREGFRSLSRDWMRQHPALHSYRRKLYDAAWGACATPTQPGSVQCALAG